MKVSDVFNYSSSLRISIDIKSIDSLIFNFFTERKLNETTKNLDDQWERIVKMKYEDFKINKKYEKEIKFIKTKAKKLSNKINKKFNKKNKKFF